MLKFLNPLRQPVNWIKHRNSEPLPPCALATCPGPQSLWLRLRRRSQGAFLQGVFYCQPQCLGSALAGQLSRLRVLAPAPLPPNRIPLGLLMVARGKLTHIEVQAALEAQRRARYGKIGDWIEKLGFASEQDVTTALALQWGCPVALSFDPVSVRLANCIPLPILEAFQMLPINYAVSTNTLYMAFGERVDHAALYALEKILDCRTQPCVAERKAVARQLDSMRQFTRPRDVEFGPMNNISEMAHIALSYTARLSPDSVRLSRIGRFIWLRLDQRTRASTSANVNSVIRGVHGLSSGYTNIVFRLSTETPPSLPFVLPLPELPIEKSLPII